MSKPCKECPFRKESAPGYLGNGSYDPEGFLKTIEHEPLPCHLQVDWDEDDEDVLETNVMKAGPCVGALQFQKNACKSPRKSSYLKLVAGQTKNDNVFNWPHEFINHHKRA